MEMIREQLKPAAMMMIAFTVLTGIVYPGTVTVVAQLVFPGRANGSLIERNGQVIGSDLIGQPFASDRYFWSRPSATGPVPYNAAASSGSNLGPVNPAFVQGLKDRVAALRASDPDNQMPVPVDLATASGSGLDPHISPAAAHWQVRRIARVRSLPEDRIAALIQANTEDRVLGLIGEPVVNVLRLNLALDALN